MAYFYGTLNGSRGQATRCGTRSSGMHAVAASWQGCAGAWTNAPLDPDAPDRATLYLGRWHGSGRDCSIYYGPVNPSDAELFAGLFVDMTDAAFLRQAAAALNARAEVIEANRIAAELRAAGWRGDE